MGTDTSLGGKPGWHPVQGSKIAMWVTKTKAMWVTKAQSHVGH